MYVVLDLETSMLLKGVHTSDPFFDKILTIGLKYQKAIGSGQFDRELPPNEYIQDTFALAQDYMPERWLDGVDLLIGHNLAFDLKFIWRNDELQDFFARGGRIWCTQLVEYILSGQRHKYPGLRDIAISKYGRMERIKNLEGRLTQDMPIELLLEDVRNDVLDTEAVALQQAKIAKKEGMLGLILTQMDARLATIEMEYNGFKVDKEVLEQNQKELEAKLKPLSEQIDLIAQAYWPKELGEFNSGSPKQVSMLLFGGNYKVKDRQGDGLYKNGNTKYKTVDVTKTMEGMRLTPHQEWKTPSGAISVNEKVLKEMAKK